jgi:hypothetical protein
MSATGSVNFIVISPQPPVLSAAAENQRWLYFLTPNYQDDFATPGISPRNAKPRKHNRQTPNFRRYARGRPQILQRLCLRVENLGRGCLASRAFWYFSWIFASLTRFAVVMQSLNIFAVF